MCKAFEDMMKDERMEGRKEGLKEGRKEGEEKGRKKGQTIGIQALVKTLRELKCTNEYIIGKLVENFRISEKEAQEYAS